MVELMVGLAIGMTVLAGAISVVSGTVRSSSSSLTLTRLNQDMNAIIRFMSGELRKAGAWNSAATGNTNPFYLNEVSSNCVTFSYDSDNDGGSVQSDEKFAFRYNTAGKTVQYNTGANKDTCSGGSWVDINDPNVVAVTSVTFTVTPSCTNLNKDDNCSNVTNETGDIQVYVNYVNIQMTGQLASDSTVSRSIETSVKVRGELLTIM